MNKRLGKTLPLVLLTASLICGALPAQADNGHGHGYGHDKKHDRHTSSHAWYYHDDHERYRPPVVYYRPWEPVAVVPVYRVGDRLPSHVHCHEPDRNIVAVLPPVYRGTRYVQVDQNVYLVSEASKQILDAVVLLSGVR